MMNLHQIIKNKLQNKNFIYITIEGNIGVGKTRLLNKIKDEINNNNLIRENKTFFIIQEPVEIWEKTNLLNLYYSNPQKYSLAFQMTAFCTTLLPLKRFLELSSSSSSPLIIFGERSPLASIECFTPLLVERGKIDPQNEIYVKFKEICNQTLPFLYPDIIFYLNGLDVTILLERIKNRNRLGEQNITSEYLEHLEKKYNQMISSLPTATTTVIKNDDIEPALRDVLTITF